jgi:dTDP-4-dehydrorhamnose reductase
VLDAHPTSLILRTSWVFSPFGTNFLRTMLRLGVERGSLRVVSDQIGNPTSAIDLEGNILQIAPELAASAPAGGIFHLTNSGSTSWHGFAAAIFEASASRGCPRPRLETITTADYPTPARRPANSRLDTSAFNRRFGIAPRAWQQALGEVVARVLNA